MSEGGRVRPVSLFEPHTDGSAVAERVIHNQGMLKPSQREVFYNRINSGETQMAVWWGLENAMLKASMSPSSIASDSELRVSGSSRAIVATPSTNLPGAALYVVAA